MTALFIGLPVGANEFTKPTTAATTQSTVDVEVRISVTAQLAGITRNDVARLIDVIENFIVQGGQDGAGSGVPIL